MARTAEIQDPWKVKRVILLPRAQQTEQNFQFVYVNGKTFQVPKGKEVEVPLPVYEVLMNSAYQLNAAEDAARKMAGI